MPLSPRPTKLTRCLTALALALSAPAAAAPLPQSDARVEIIVRDQPIGAFLRDLFGRIEQPVVASPKLTGTVNGRFANTLDKVFADVAKAFNLVGYYDGAAVYVYSADEIGVQTIAVPAGAVGSVLRNAAAMRLGDSRNVVRAASDGTLVVSGTPRFIQQLGELARSRGGTGAGTAAGTTLAGGQAGSRYINPPDAAQPLDGMGQPGGRALEFRVFYLRYARAEDTTVDAGGREVRVPGVATIMQNLVLDRPPAMGAQPAAYGSRPLRQSQPRLKGQGLDSVPPSDFSSTPVLGLSGAEGGIAGDDAQALPPADTNTVRIQANPYLNAVIIRDVPERMAAYDSLVRALDVEPQLVEIEATIIDINTNKLDKLGINWRFGSGGFGALFGNGTSSDRRLLPTDGSRRDNVSNITPSAQGLALSTIIGSNREFLARINALEARGAARVVSRPQVMTLSNVEAVFDRTRTFYVRVAGREEVDLFNVTAGTVLRVNPHVFRDHDQTRIRVLIGIEDGNITAGDVENIPIVERSSVSTQAMIADGESLLLGGMTVDSDVEALDKIPLLGNIPVLGELFKSRSRERGRTERLFLITPRIATLTPRLEAANAAAAAAAAQVTAQPGAVASAAPAAAAPAPAAVTTSYAQAAMPAPAAATENTGR